MNYLNNLLVKEKVKFKIEIEVFGAKVSRDSILLNIKVFFIEFIGYFSLFRLTIFSRTFFQEYKSYAISVK